MYHVVYISDKMTEKLICYKAFTNPKHAIRYADNVPDSCTIKIEKKVSV